MGGAGDLARPADVLAILPEFHHPADDGQSVFKTLALGEGSIGRPDPPKGGARDLIQAEVAFMQSRDRLRIAAKQVGGGNDQRLRVVE